MKNARIDFTLSIDVAVDDRLDLDWVANSFLNSDRFSIDRVTGDPQGVGVLAACSGVKEIVVYRKG